MALDLTDTLFATHTPLAEIAFRLGLAVVLSAGVGFEREASRKPAGLRTHMLVALASAAFTIVAIEMVAGSAAKDPATVNTDPIRVIEAIIAGVAFLGAGTIIRARDNVVGITTGASIWLAGAIGLACGGGHYAVAVLTLMLALVTLTVIRVFERSLMGKGGKEP